MHKLSLSLEGFANILNLPHGDIVLDSGDKVYNFNIMFDASSLVKNPSHSIPNTLIARYICFDSCMIHYMINHIRFLRKNNFGLIIQSDIEFVWVIENKIKTS